jgi:hypothetical protein
MIPNEVNLARGVMMGVMSTLATHPELDPVIAFIALRNMVDEQLDIMISQLTETENGTHDTEEDHE